MINECDITEQQQAAEELNDIHKKHERAIELGRLGFWEWDHINEKMTSCSEVLAQIYEMSMDEMLAFFSSHEAELDIVHPQDRDRYEQHLQEMIEQRHGTDIEYRMITLSGNIRHLYQRSEKVLDGQGNIIRSFGVEQDITERKLQEEEKHKSQVLSRQAEELGNLGQWEWDFVNDRISYCSEAMAQIYEMSVDEAMVFFSEPNSELKIAHPDDRDRYEQHVLEMEEKRQGSDIEFRIITGLGNVRHIHQRSTLILDDDGNIVSSYGLEQDITERKLGEEALRKSYAYYRQAEEIGKLGHWEWDEIEHRIISCSEQYAQILGTSVDEMLGKYANYDDDLVLIHPDDRQRYDDMIREYQRNNVWMDIEYRIITPVGKEVYVREVGEPEFDEHGTLVRTFGTLQNITERKKLETALRQHQLHLETEVSRRTADLVVANTDLQAFAHSIAHDLKAPLRSIEGFAHILREDYRLTLDETGHQHLLEISSSSLRMGNMVDDLLSHARLGQDFADVSEIDLNMLLKMVKQDLAGDIQERNAEISFDGKLITINGHQRTLKALLENLVSNAIKYVEPEKRPEVIISMSETDEEYLINVKDNGIGIAKEYQDKIFGIFERLHTREEYPGTGVGLATVEKAVQLHGGRLWLESEPGKGTTFYFSIAKDLSTISKTNSLH